MRVLHSYRFTPHTHTRARVCAVLTFNAGLKNGEAASPDVLSQNFAELGTYDFVDTRPHCQLMTVHIFIPGLIICF